MISMSYISYRHYLVEYSDSYVENFRLQNLDLIESNSTLQLTQKFELTKCPYYQLLAKLKIVTKFSTLTADAIAIFSMRLIIALKLTPAGNNKIEILFEMKLPTNLKISFLFSL